MTPDPAETLTLLPESTPYFGLCTPLVQAQKRLQIEKSAGITVAGNLVTDMGSASRFELALFMRKLLTR